ncbi:MAG: SsrA-binding protein [Candidatus Handelsmanbacteria bacterium RIFCSPLOWO2_12_FULL_64_10]|uniref:SsrA-binding protein n=1 Tax=Handelsmanbacteria sp. (strain RIFCSPLOWO2_12_FULL_64_10) TaxID=1817868 RepID=A0A1F6CFB3_HANXR|nr:MAG: SsrA-binding protein [Candidatus Handelsmanbacteria bacterium RIFCSPLOWO2_12_FULL_64_10]
MDEPIKVIAQNRRARHEYHILETFEAGLALRGTEVKSLRMGKASLPESYARVENGEVFLLNAHIDEYDRGNRFNHDPTRRRKLLLHRREINRLIGRVEERGLTLVPLRMYFRRGKAKVELALARGKKTHDKREDIARREAEREIAAAMKSRRQGR